MTKHFSPRRKSSKNSFSRKRFDRPKRVRKGPYKYFVFWKPYDVLSQFKPAKGSNAETLASYINVAGIYPTGRLDRDSEGLLLLSDDGQFQHKLCEPKFEHWRTYLVQVERAPTEEALATEMAWPTSEDHPAAGLTEKEEKPADEYQGLDERLDSLQESG